MTALRITLVDTINDRRLSVTLPDDVPMEQLVPALASKLGLPEGDYELTVEEIGAPLGAGVTLASAGIAEGQELLLRAKVERERPKPAILPLTLVDTINDRRLSVALPDDVLLEQLVPALARKLGLPEGEYALRVEETGAPLAAGVTLAGAGVDEGATLRLERAVREAPPAKPVPPPPAPPPPVAPAPKAGLPRWAWAVGGVVLLGLLLTGVLALMGVFGRKQPPILRTLEVGGEIESLAFSPDGATIASGRGKVILWDAQTGQQLRSFSLEDGYWAASLAFSPDGMTLAQGTYDEDPAVILWDVETGRQIRTLGGEIPCVGASVAFSPDGKTLASGLLDGTVILWDLRTGWQLRTLGEGKGCWPFGGLWPVAFSPDGTILASVSASGDYPDTVFWDVGTGQQLHTLEYGDCYDAAFSPDGHILATADGYAVELWDVQTGKGLRTLGECADDPISVAFSPDGATLASGSRDGRVILWDPQTGQKLHTLKGHKGRVTMTFSPDGTILASGCDESTVVILWDMAR